MFCNFAVCKFNIGRRKGIDAKMEQCTFTQVWNLVDTIPSSTQVG